MSCVGIKNMKCYECDMKEDIEFTQKLNDKTFKIVERKTACSRCGKLIVYIVFRKVKRHEQTKPRKSNRHS
jgi:hypothetical protein